MHYVIDANNLAGRLQLLDKQDFDKQLILIIKNFFVAKKHRIDLVFDGRDNMGDKFKDENVNIIYTPRDSYYIGADDKIVELVNGDLEGLEHGFVFVVTDDLELIERVKKVSDKIQILRVSEFALQIKIQSEIEDVEESLSAEEEDEITREMMRIWK